jgi:hypothetical protein
MPDLHDLAPVVDADAAWRIFTNAARRRRTRRRLVSVFTTVAVVIAAIGIAHFATQGGSRARVDIDGQPTVPRATIRSTQVCAPAQLTATVGFVNNASEALGGVVFANHAATPCTLSGRPAVRLSTSSGRDLAIQQESGVAGNTPASSPNRPIVLSAHTSQPQGGVMLAWRNWCAALPGAVVVSIQFAAWHGNLVAAPAAHADTNTVPPCIKATRPTTITVGSVETHDATGFVLTPSQPPESIPVVVPPSLPPESIPQGIINDASVPFHSSDVAIKNVWQVVYKGHLVQVYFGAQVVNEYKTALESPTAQGIAIVTKSPSGSGTGGPADVTGFRFRTPQKSGALRAVSATATTVTATTPGGAKFTYDVTTGTFVQVRA